MKTSPIPPGKTTATGMPSPADADQAAAATPLASGARISSDKLLAGASELEIDHNGVLYRLRKTSLGKLILTK